MQVLHYVYHEFVYESMYACICACMCCVYKKLKRYGIFTKRYTCNILSFCNTPPHTTAPSSGSGGGQRPLTVNTSQNNGNVTIIDFNYTRQSNNPYKVETNESYPPSLPILYTNYTHESKHTLMIPVLVSRGREMRKV